MNKKIIIIGLIVLVVAFYGGSVYGKSSASKTIAGNFNRQGGQMAGNFAGRTLGQNSRGGATLGEILSMDSNSITLKLRDGGSKIIFFVASTTVSKMTSASINDLKVGSQISVSGSANADGSISALSIQEIPIRTAK